MFVVASLVALVSIGVFVGARLFLGSRVGRAAVLADTFAREAKQDERLRSLKQALANTEIERAQLFGEHLVAADGVVPFIERIEGLGALAGVEVEINSIGVGALPENETTLERLSLELRAAGSWAAIYRFLGLVESLPLPVVFEDIRLDASLTPGAGSSWRGVFTFNVLKAKE